MNGVSASSSAGAAWRREPNSMYDVYVNLVLTQSWNSTHEPPQYHSSSTPNTDYLLVWV